MIAGLDSIGAILTAIIAALIGAVAIITKMWSGEKEKREAADQQIDEWVGIIERERKLREAIEKTERAAAQAEEKAVKEAKQGRRDHFEGQ